MTMQNLINELVNEYIQSKYDEKYLKEKITKISYKNEVTKELDSVVK